MSESIRSDWASGIRTGDHTYQDSETTERSHGEQGDSGILKRGRRGQATLCLSLDTTGTGCRDYQSELSDSVLEGEKETQREASHSSCHVSKSTTPRDNLGWDTHNTNETGSRSPCMRPRSDPPKMKNSNVVRSRLIILINEEINEANWMVSNSARLDCRTKQHTQFGVSASNGSRDMARTKSWRTKRKKKNKKKLTK